MAEKMITVKVIRPGSELQEMEISPTDQLAMPLGTTIIGPDHWDSLVSSQKQEKKSKAADMIAAQFGATVNPDLRKKLDGEKKGK